MDNLVKIVLFQNTIKKTSSSFTKKIIIASLLFLLLFIITYPLFKNTLYSRYITDEHVHPSLPPVVEEPFASNNNQPTVQPTITPTPTPHKVQSSIGIVGQNIPVDFSDKCDQKTFDLLKKLKIIDQDWALDEVNNIREPASDEEKIKQLEKIPKVIHQLQFNTSWGKDYISKYPDFEYIVWDSNKIKNDLYWN